MSLSGNLKTVSFPDILQLLATGKKTGILEIKTRTRSKEIAFKAGDITFARSTNNAEDLLGNMLLRRGRIAKEDLERAITLHKQTGRQLGTTLIDMKLFTKDEIIEYLRLQVEEIVYNLFAWDRGDFMFQENKEPTDAPFLINLNTMNVVMEGTRRIDEWHEIQKVLPADDVMLALAESPQTKQDELRISMDEFRLLALINGERTLPDLVRLSPMGEFVTYRAAYRLMGQKLIVAAGKREGGSAPVEDDEELLMSIIFTLFGRCFVEIRKLVESLTGPSNQCFASFAKNLHTGLMTYFTGLDPDSEAQPSFDKFLAAVRSLPAETRYHRLMSGLDKMLSQQLEYVYRLLGEGAFRRATTGVKKQIAEPLAQRRELVSRYGLEDDFYRTLRRADQVVKMIRG
ncbi:MAG: DUF4388 domain-containing protein [bacterium]